MTEVESPSNHAPSMERYDSMSSIDKELDLLIGPQTDNVDSGSQDGREDEFYPRSESRREEPSSQYPLNEAGPELHGTAVDSEPHEHETSEYNELSNEQKLLELELQKLQEEGFLPMDDPPEYDIADRVRELNEQLRAEGEIPERTDRKVKFSENVIAVEFAEDQYDDDEFETGASENVVTESENVDGDATQSSKVTDPNDLEVAKLTLEEKTGTSEIETKDSENQRNLSSNGQSPRGQDDKVLIERDGKFEFINVKDLSTDERQLMGLEVLPDETDQPKHEPVTPNGHGDAPIPPDTPPEKTPTQLQPTPPSKPRPSTATDSTGLHRTQLQPRRIQSARTQRESSGHSAWSVTYTGHSKYGLTPEQKEHKKEQLRLRMQREQEERKTTEEEQRKKQEDAESAFQGWLHNKQNAHKQRRQSEKEQTKRGDEKKDLNSTDEIYQDWLQTKQTQAKHERKLKKQAEQERVDGFYIRDRKECDQAFKQWVRSKNDQLRRERSLKRSKESRKSKSLAKALETAQIYRYTDWYGYRF